MFFHGMGYGPHIGLFGGGFSFIIMFLIFMFVISILRRSFYGSNRGYRGYRGYRRYQRPYQPYDPRTYQGGQNPENGTETETPRNESQYYGSGSQAGQDDTGVKTVRTDSSPEQNAGNGTGTPTTRVDNTPGVNGEPTRPL